MRVITRHVRSVIPGLVFALLAALAMSAHADQTRSGPPVVVPADGRLTVVGKEFEFIPNAIQVKKGQHVTIMFKNEGTLSHNLTIPDLRVRTPTIQAGTRTTIEFTAKETGSYPFWCAVPGHKQAGMLGELNVME